jgi:hypothetical protein
MAFFHETVQFTDPPLPPKEPTPSQRLFRAWMKDGDEGFQAEYDRMYPEPVPVE